MTDTPGAPRATEERTALWGEDGDPLTAEAAIADALEWLDDLRRMRVVKRDVDMEAALTRAISCLAAYGDADARAKYPEVSHV